MVCGLADWLWHRGRTGGGTTGTCANPPAHAARGAGRYRGPGYHGRKARKERPTMNFRYSLSQLSLACAEILVVLTLVRCNSLPGRPGPGPEVVRPDEVLAFNTLYKQNCSGCHGAEGKGGAAPSLADPVYLALVSDATLRQVMTNGVPRTAMRGFARKAGGTLTDRQIDVLVREIRARWAKPEALGGTNPPSYLA